MDDKTIKTVQAVADGSLAENIKNNARYIMTGIIFGAVTGVVIAGFFGKSKLVFGLVGAAGFGAGGYLMNNRDKTEKTNSK